MSTILLLLAVILVRLPSVSKVDTSGRTMIDSAGVLQIIWLLGREPHMAEVVHPKVQALRAAGMFDVQMARREEIYLGDAALQGSAGDFAFDGELTEDGESLRGENSLKEK